MGNKKKKRLQNSKYDVHALSEDSDFYFDTETGLISSREKNHIHFHSQSHLVATSVRGCYVQDSLYDEDSTFGRQRCQIILVFGEVFLKRFVTMSCLNRVDNRLSPPREKYKEVIRDF
ncbi:hypothetical protein NPIL_355331 [Nephila pilipes]|uniref:Uncharacterized protein n=1 Tax=Nephila pilipes TaxID=299642 RepID=A0A8X6QSB6_NEPPI|nr:hypothetical protein NPIL_355331 [Nephila pilipes]